MIHLSVYLLALFLFAFGCSPKVLNVSREPERVFFEESPKHKQETQVYAKETKKEEKKKEETLSPQSFEPFQAKFENELLSESEEVNLRDLLDEKTLGKFDIPIVFNEAVQYFINYFLTEKRKVFSNWLKRSQRYVPLMREILRKEGLPEDLVYLAMIESGFNPKAYSPKKASGPWQFIYKTGERYGLKVDHWVDERRDPEKSTVAAARYLKDLFDQFGCWYLAAASYNVGEKRVERVVEMHNTRDIWELIKYNTLPRETREYIPKLIAAAIIAKNHESFGFEKISYDNPIRFVRLEVPRATPLKYVAEAAGVDLDTVRSYNPEILRGITPPNREFVIKLPEWVNKEKFKEKLLNILSNQRKLKDYIAYRVKKNDTVMKISARYGVSKEILCLWNTDKETIKLKPGSLIYIPRFLSDEDEKKEKEKPVFAKYKTKAKGGEKRIIYYRVKKGDTLSSVSKRYGVDVYSIKVLNNLKNDKISPGMILKIAVQKR